MSEGTNLRTEAFYRGDPMTLKIKRGLEIPKMNLYTKDEPANSRHSKVKAQIEKNTQIALKIKSK